ncbi:hypothetical protein Dimus_006633 [Dionaea muscipula]
MCYTKRRVCAYEYSEHTITGKHCAPLLPSQASSSSPPPPPPLPYPCFSLLRHCPSHSLLRSLRPPIRRRGVECADKEVAGDSVPQSDDPCRSTLKTLENAPYSLMLMVSPLRSGVRTCIKRRFRTQPASGAAGGLNCSHRR